MGNSQLHLDEGFKRVTIESPVITKPKQTTRLRKVSCEFDNYIVRVSRSTLITFGAPICPACNRSMTEAGR